MVWWSGSKNKSGNPFVVVATFNQVPELEGVGVELLTRKVCTLFVIVMRYSPRSVVQPMKVVSGTSVTRFFSVFKIMLSGYAFYAWG